MADRAYFLDRGFGESRGVVTLQGRPERLIIARDTDPPCQALGARSIGRVTKIDRQSALAFVALEAGPEAVINLRSASPPLAQGAVVEVEVKSEARGDKGAVVHLIGPGRGAPRLTSPAPDLETRMRVLARSEGVDSGSGARRAADAAQDEAIEPLFSLPGGGQIAVEPTRALTAVDVDMAAAHGPAGKAMVKAVNLAAIREAARVLRLKGLGGLVVIDFVGRGHDGPALLAAARSAFAPDNPGVAIGPVSRFGLMELAIPRRARPVVDILRGGRPGLGPATVAMNLLRALERQAMADPGGRFEVATAPDIAEAAGKGFEALIAKLGARIALRPEQDRVEFEIRRS
ncbi:MAG TPA: ribonuclease E/G [Caulobacteraceae bacterium]|jgi:hypothetical protein|nr:ribonuclease E/G [Caulobacteraceae bacterium]